MPAEDLSDDLVAQILKKDARSSSAKYAAVGLSAFTPRRSTAHAPKPNTQFLRNVLRDTDNHNTALLAKEAEVSRARLRALRGSEHGRSESHKGDAHRASKRRRIDDGAKEARDKYCDRHSTSRRDLSPERPRRRSRRTREEGSDEEDDRRGHRSRRAHRDRDSRRYLHRSESDGNEHKRSERSSRRHRHRTSHNRSRSPSKSSDRLGNRHWSRSKSRSRSRSRSRSLDRMGNRHWSHHSRRGSRAEREHSSEADRRRLHKPVRRGSDSDPLEDIVGPPPPPPPSKVRLRGRGAFTASSKMDSHFAADYDPSADVRVGSDVEDDWDMALEALRDRQRWRQQGADRLRQAGFTDDEVRKWEKGGEKTEEDVRWSKKGEGREWDRGKVLDADGDIKLRAEWGRLKGT